MFALNRDARPAPARSGLELPPSFLGISLKIRGVIEAEGTLTIAGHVIGRIAAIRLVIAPGGHIEGDIVARGAHFDGRMPWRPVSYFETLDQLPETQP